MELPTITVTPPAPPGEAAPAPVPALAPGPKPEDKVVELGEEQLANMFLWVSGAKFWHPKFQKAEKERRKRILRGLR